MGGFGSGFKLIKKDTVEFTYMRISVDDFKVGSNEKNIKSATLQYRKNQNYPYEIYNLEYAYKDDKTQTSTGIANNEESDNSYTVILSKGLNSQNIRIVTTKVHFGGYRYWFECPKCRHKAKYLYITKPNDTFACRECKQLTYYSVQKHDNSRSSKNIEKFLLSLSAQLEKSHEKYLKMQGRLNRIRNRDEGGR
jgi:hypothetical protein